MHLFDLIGKVLNGFREAELKQLSRVSYLGKICAGCWTRSTGLKARRVTGERMTSAYEDKVFFFFKWKVASMGKSFAQAKFELVS